MISDIMARIETILESSALSEIEKDNLGTLATNLHKELDSVPEDKKDYAISVASFTEVALRETVRIKRDPKLVEHASAGLKESVSTFSADHPKISQLVDKICNFFSDSGI